MDFFLQEKPSLAVDYQDLLVKLFDCGLVIENVLVFRETIYGNNTRNLIQSTINRLTKEQRLGSK